MQRVVVNDETADWIQLHHGLPQGTIIGPLLFSLYVNDLEQKTREIIQYADDTVPLTSHCDVHVCKKSPEHSIEDIPDYFTSLALKINADKTGFIVFGKKNQPHLLQNRDQKIEETAQVKYLGVTIDNELSYQTEVKNLVSKKAQSIDCFLT